MSAVPRSDSQPEKVVRQILHSLGFRFRLHRRDLPGSPDIVLPRLRKVIFVHGCFWHRHGCRLTTTPKSNRAFWEQKFEVNRERDKNCVRQLKQLEWQSYIVWQCQLKRPESVARRLLNYLES